MSTNALILFAGIFLISVFVGTALGILFRGRLGATAISGLVLSIGLGAFIEWIFGKPNEWSWHRPLESFLYLAAPFLILILAPLLISGVIACLWCEKISHSTPEI
jgi:hypothetical protein